MQTSITILGSGTCVPSLKRSACAVLMQIGDCRILFDSGPGTMRRLLEAHTRIFELSYICYSHFHPDHSGELVPLIFATKYPDSSRRRIPLTILAGLGFQTFFEGLQAVYGDWIELPQGMLHIVELDNSLKDLREFEYFRVETIPVKHNEESIAYKITDPIGHSVVYSGDTDYTENLISLAQNADVLICESALPDNLKVSGHLSPSLAGKIASLANVKKLVLTHLYPECDQVDINAQCRKTYAGPLVIAEDLLRIEL